MAGAQTTVNYSESYPDYTPQLPGQSLPWLRALRNAAQQEFAARGFPGPSEEDWRYTSLAALNKTRFAPSASQEIDANWLDAHRLPEAWSVVLLNGRFSPELSRLADLPSGLAVQGLAQALEQTPTSVQDVLGRALAGSRHTLAVFNDAWFQDGVLIRLAAGQVANRPLQIIHVVSDEAALAASRQLWVLEADSRAEIVETYIGSAGGYFTAAINEVFLGENAELALYKVQEEADKALHFGGTYVKQAARSRFSHHNFAFGGLLTRSELHSDLEQAAECRLNGLFPGSNRRHIDNLLRINHLKPQGFSRVFYKGVLDQKARGVFQGRVVVSADAQHTDSQMNNRNLLLSEDAEIDTKPQLEIYADDVKCSHGVTVGQLEEKSVFYLQSRGLDEAAARNILTFAFANEMVDKVEIPALKALLFSRLLAHFPAIGPLSL